MTYFFRGLIFFFLVVSQFSRASELIDFSIDKKLFDQLDSNKQVELSTRVSELKTFFSDEVLSIIPDDILNQIKDVAVKIVISDNDGRDGLFIPDQNNHNHKIMIQLNQLNSKGIKSLIAHEFFHAIHFELNRGVGPWIREGLAQVFEYMVTKEFNGQNLAAAIRNPYTPLMGQYNIDETSPAQYGHDLLYFYYLYEHCGGETFFWKLTKGESHKKGSDLIDDVLANEQNGKKECLNFKKSAVYFEVSKFHNQIQFEGPVQDETFFLLPMNISPDDSETVIDTLPLYSALKMPLLSWKKLKSASKKNTVFYVKKSFPFTITTGRPSGPAKLYDVIIVKSSL